MKIGLEIRTIQVAGRYQHNVKEFGVGPSREGEISNEVVEAFQRANEALYEEMPQGASGLVSKIMYKK